MKTKKLDLKELQVESFVTSLRHEEKQTVLGGEYPNRIEFYSNACASNEGFAYGNRPCKPDEFGSFDFECQLEKEREQKIIRQELDTFELDKKLNMPDRVVV